MAATPTSPLLGLPATVLSAVLELLEPAELVRTVALITKHPALARFAHGGDGPTEASFWTRLLGQRLGRFTPAHAWFDVKGNGAHDGKLMYEAFPGYAGRGDRQLQRKLEAAGLDGASWAWDGPQALRQFTLVQASIPPNLTMERFMEWVEVFECNSCHTHGTATAQCARCCMLLCGKCSFGCGETDVTCEDGGRVDKCPFALCSGCRHVTQSVFTFYAFSDPQHPIPGYLTPACHCCPRETRWCHAHPEAGFLTCWSCEKRRCDEHTSEEPAFKICSICDFEGCLYARRECHEASGSIKQFACDECDAITCSGCRGEGGACPLCGGEMQEYKPYLNGGEEAEESDGEDGGEVMSL